MKLPQSPAKKGGISPRLLLLGVILALLPLVLMAQAPDWWGQRGVTNGNQANDYAMANIGQVKNLFSFDLTLTGTNGLPDWWQKYYFEGQVPDPNALAPSGVLGHCRV